MEVWFEYELAVEGETLTITVRFYPSQGAAQPMVTDRWSYVLTAEDVTVGKLRDRLYGRVRQLETGMARWEAINTALAAGQNTRLRAVDVVGA